MAMIELGDILNDSYRVTSYLGHGAFGDVFLAENTLVRNHKVAVKVLPRADDHTQDMLVREMELLANARHPHVVTFHGHFHHDHQLCLVMEYCSGGSLHDKLQEKGHFPIVDVTAWGIALCDTLAFVHGRQIVHHDIKPVNILFADDGSIKIGDFGVANINIGTVIYLPPEMILRERVDPLDPRVDIYSLGITLLELLTGDHPFIDLSAEEALQLRIEQDFVPVTIERWMQEVLLKATHPTPEMRFQTAVDFSEALQSMHVPFVLNSSRVKADALARRAENALKRKKWKTARTACEHALKSDPTCVSALIAAGRWQLLIHRLDRAEEYFTEALRINPRAPIQKELGWLYLERGLIPKAISFLTDYLHRKASDFEAANLLLKCFYLTNRYEAGIDLAQSVMMEKATNTCFINNQLLCQIFEGSNVAELLDSFSTEESPDPIIRYNLTVIAEGPRSWSRNGAPGLKSKLIFEEYGYGIAY